MLQLSEDLSSSFTGSASGLSTLSINESTSRYFNLLSDAGEYCEIGSISVFGKLVIGEYDTEAEVKQQYERMLKKYGYEIYVASTGGTLKKIQRYDYYDYE